MALPAADTAEGGATYTCTLPPDDGHRQHEANLSVTPAPGGTCQIANLSAYV